MRKDSVTFFKIVGAAVAIVAITHLLRQCVTLTVSVPKVRVDVVVETTPGPTVVRPTRTDVTIASPTPLPLTPTALQPSPTPAPTQETEKTPQREPVAYYPFDGNANDESGNGNHGTVYGAKLTADRFGNQDSAYLFDGIIDDVRVYNRALSAAEVERLYQVGQ